MNFQELDWTYPDGDSVKTFIEKMEHNIKETYYRNEETTFYRNGSLVVVTGRGRQYLWYNANITAIRVSVDTPPTGGDIIVDVNKNGSSLYTTQLNRPTIPAGQNTVLATLPDTVGLLEGDYLTMDIDQIGSTNPGKDLTVQVLYQPA